MNGNVMQLLAVARYAHGRRGACLHADDDGIVGEEAPGLMAEGLERPAQPVANEWW